MNPALGELELAESHIAEWLSSLGLGVEYVRSEGNTLFYRGADGADVEVLDMVGGYGSTILGHNNPEIVAYAKALLDGQTPVHAQFSKHPYANDLARKLNVILQRDSGVSEPYSAIFANSGAEAIEVAIKHAELDRVLKLTALTARMEANIELAREAVRDGATVVTDGVFPALNASAGAGFDSLVAAIRSVNGERMTAQPIFLAPEGSFHGKLAGSVQLTHNAGYRTPFKAMAAQCRFVPVDEPDVLAKVIESEKKTLFDLAVENGVVRVIEQGMPIVAAFVMEPIQGEAGIHPFDRDTVQRIQDACAAADCPIIVDEIQSGMGRSGSFFASSQIGLVGDYYTLAKSLGGGIAKAAVTLIRGSHYRKDFELVHSSTYAKDSFSTLIAGKTVDLLEADGGKAYQLAAEQGSRLLAMLTNLKTDFGDIVKDVRGTGLMVGLEFHDQSDSASEIIREQARAGLLGYLFSGYLLREHSLRIFPTASSTSTLRFEPSVYLTDAEIAKVESGLRGLIAVLVAQDGQTLLGA